MKHLGQKIKSIREKQGLSQLKLGEIAGIPQPVITRLETGATNPRMDTILKLVDALGYKFQIVKKRKNKTFKELISEYE